MRPSGHDAPQEIDPANLDALEQLMPLGLADVVTVDGEPQYVLSSRFVHDAPE